MSRQASSWVNRLFCMSLLCGLLSACALTPARASAVRREELIIVPGGRLFALVRGDNPEAPILVWLHGGPGGAERPLFRLYNAALERSFVVVYLDQRGTGRSFDPKADPRALTIARHVQDLDLVVDQIRREQSQDKVVLLGHSWGSALGLFYAQAHPEKVSAFIGVGQVSSELGRQWSQFHFVEDEARRRGDAQATDRLNAIGPPPYSAAREIATQRLVERFGGYYRVMPDMKRVIVRGILGGHVRPWELQRLFRGNAVSLTAMNDEILNLDLPAQVPEVQVPVAFLLGRYDRQVDSRLAEAYFHQLKTPAKALVWFENSAHNAPFEEPALFNATVPRVARQLGVPAEVAP